MTESKRFGNNSLRKLWGIKPVVTEMKRSEISLSDLCRVGRDTPAGDWFRHYWMVVGTTRELQDIPRAIRVLGEDLVLFRDEHGRIGLLGLHCPHRASSLEYGDNWFNFIENGADPVHFSILHRADPDDGTWRSWFFNFKDVPPFDAVETSYGMKVISRKPGPTPDTEYVDEKSFALPSILQIGDTEFTHFKKPKEALADGSRNAHFMFVTPNDDDHFTLFTVNHYTGPDPDFFQKLAPSRRIAPEIEKKPYDKRKHSPFRGSVRSEDIMSQSTQGTIAERKEQLASSDKGVILLRKIILKDIQTVQEGGAPKGIPLREEPDKVIDIDSFTGIRAKGVT